MDKLRYFFECLIPITVCNFRCHYCYVIQRHSNSMKMPKMQYSPEQIRKALTQKRIGGIAYFSICGAGETLMVRELPEIVYGLLAEGHYVNLTTNGTWSKGFECILHYPAEYLQRLQFAFSFHYLELMRLNKVEIFFENVQKVKNAGCSFLVQVNLCDEYEPYLEDIKKIMCGKGWGLPTNCRNEKRS